MKYFIYFFAAISILSACNKKADIEPVLPPNYWGEATAEKNGQLWSAHPGCWIDLVDKKSIVVELDSFFKGRRLYYLAESLIIAKIPPIPGTYKVERSFVDTAGTNSHFGFWDDDQPLGLYNILESDSATNRVTLASYDTLTKEIKGSFNLTYIVVNRPYPHTPDTIRFRNGQFHGKLVKK